MSLWPFACDVALNRCMYCMDAPLGLGIDEYTWCIGVTSGGCHLYFDLGVYCCVPCLGIVGRYLTRNRRLSSANPAQTGLQRLLK